MIDRYFKRPILIDFIFGIIVSAILYYLNQHYCFMSPKYDALLSLTTDLSTVSLTFAGFILTLLTVLITFKMGAKVPTTNEYEEISLFDLFFSTRLYTTTISLLKGCIISLGVISLVGFCLKLLLDDSKVMILFLFNAAGIVVISLTFARSLLILSKITSLQDESDNQRRIDNAH